MRIRIPAITLLILLLSSLSFAQENKLVQFHMAIVKKGPNWTDPKTGAAQKVLQEHVSYVMSLLGSGKAVAAGPFGDEEGIQGIFIYRAANADEAKSWADADPAAKAGHHSNELHPWWSEDIFGKAATPMKLETVYLGFLKRGPNRKEGDGQTHRGRQQGECPTFAQPRGPTGTAPFTPLE